MSNKITLNRELFLERMSRAMKFVPDTSIIPMFDNVRLTIKNNMMEILTANSEAQIKLWCPVNSKTDFAIAVPAELLFKTVSLFRDTEITITQKSEKAIEIKAGKSKYNISLDCLAEHFDSMNITDIKSEITMHQSMLTVALKNCKDFIDEKHPNGNFAALGIREVNNRIIFTGTTGVSICRASVRPISISKWDDTSISVSCVKNILSLISDKGEISVVHSIDKIKFFISGAPEDCFEMISTLHKGKFPDAEKFFQNMPSDVITVNTSDFSDALRRLRLYYAVGEKPQVMITNEGHTQEFHCSSVDTNTEKSGEEMINITNLNSSIFSKNLATDYVLQVLNKIDSAEVDIVFSPAQVMWYIHPKVQNKEEEIFIFALSQINK